MEITNGYAIMGIIVFFIVLVIYGLKKKKRLENESISEMNAEYGADNILVYDEKTMYYGLASKGMLQTHSQGGIFVLTPTLVRFKSWDYGDKTFGVVVTFDFIIPLDRLQSYGMAKKVTAAGPIGKFSGDGILVLQFIDENGDEDELALHLQTKEKQALVALEELTGQSAFKRT